MFHHILALWTGCVNLQQNQFISFENIILSGLVMDEWANEWINGQPENIMPPAAILVRQTHKNKSV